MPLLNGAAVGWCVKSSSIQKSNSVGQEPTEAFSRIAYTVATHGLLGKMVNFVSFSIRTFQNNEQFGAVA